MKKNINKLILGALMLSVVSQPLVAFNWCTKCVVDTVKENKYVAVLCAAIPFIGFGAWFGYKKYKAHVALKAAQAAKLEADAATAATEAQRDRQGAWVKSKQAEAERAIKDAGNLPRLNALKDDVTLLDKHIRTFDHNIDLINKEITSIKASLALKQCMIACANRAQNLDVSGLDLLSVPTSIVNQLDGVIKSFNLNKQSPCNRMRGLSQKLFYATAQYKDVREKFVEAFEHYKTVQHMLKTRFNAATYSVLQQLVSAWAKYDESVKLICNAQLPKIFQDSEVAHLFLTKSLDQFVGTLVACRGSLEVEQHIKQKEILELQGSGNQQQQMPAYA